ncbi:MAG: cell division protein FtsA [Candidatus Coatesbacteria bacterium]|nr:cell division protein FtsA [Candidatus Coatesbacteria bacterium]
MEEDGIIVVGLDIGSTKVATIVAEVFSSSINIMGIGTSETSGIREGIVIDLQETVNSIRRSVDEAQNTSGIKISSVFVSISGNHIRDIESKGLVTIARPDKEITEEDVRRVLDNAKMIVLPSDTEILHILPREYIIDGQSGIKYPIGMNGIRLEAEVQVIVGSTPFIQNIRRAVQGADLEIEQLIAAPLASTESVLDPDEKELGVVLIDIGGGTTEIAAFFDGSLRRLSILNFGGKHVTYDIAKGLQTPINQAEIIKKEKGLAMSNLAKEDIFIDLQLLGGRGEKPIPQHILCGIIEDRLQEILVMAHDDLLKLNLYNKITLSIILTGGTSNMKGIDILAEKIFTTTVKTGAPRLKDIKGLTNPLSDPSFATVLGLIYWGKKHYLSGSRDRRYANRKGDWFKRFVHFFKRFL